MSVRNPLMPSSQHLDCILASIHHGPVIAARKLGVPVGRNCRLISTKPATFDYEPYLVKIGEHFTKTADDCFLTHDSRVCLVRRESPELDVVRPLRIGENVFISLNSTILPRVTIDDDIVAAAGSVVTRDVPDGSVWGGVSAKIIRSWMTAGGASNTKSLPLWAFSNREAGISAEPLQERRQAVECRGENIGCVSNLVRDPSRTGYEREQ